MMCPAERVLKLYNQSTGRGAKRIAKSVREWFAAEAQQAGWAGVHFFQKSNRTTGRAAFSGPHRNNSTSLLTLRNEY